MDGVLLGGLMAGGSAALTLVLSQWFALLHTKAQRKHDLLVLRRAKLEELALRLNDALSQVSEMGWAMDIKALQTYSTPMSLRHAYALTQIYFPKLRPYAEDLMMAWIDVYANLVESMGVPGVSAAAQAEVHNAVARRHSVAAFLTARQAIDTAIEEHAPEYVTS